MTNLEAALGYAALGWPVMPAEGKRPLTFHGVNDATTSPTQIEFWWTRWPNANIAIATGAPGPDVLDIDNPDAADDRVIDGLLAAPQVETARGFHLYFKGSDARTLKLPYGELRRKGSYVIAPPSQRADGEPYRWIGGNPAADGAIWGYAPYWLTEGRSTAGSGPAPEVELVGPGDMYDHLLDYSVRLARAGLPVESAERALVAEFEARRMPFRSYGGSVEDTRRLAAAPSEIRERELEALRSPLKGGMQGSEEAVEGLVFRTPAELRRDTPAEPSWVWEGAIARGMVTIVGGRPKVGKSTLIYEAIDRLVRGEPMFMGGRLTATDVVVVSEEHSITALDKLRDSDRLHVLTREHAFPQPAWPDLIGQALDEAKRVGAGLVLIDSFTFWASLDEDAGNQSGSVQAALRPLVQAARDGIGVLLIHHQRKAGGEYGDALLGSTAFAANADIILEVERTAEGTPSSHRRINRVGRWYLPPVILASWTKDEGYQLVAEVDSTADAEDLSWAERIRQLFRPYGRELRKADLDGLLGVDSRTWARGLQQLLDAGELIQSGAGGVKDPFKLRSVAPQDRPTQPAI